MVRRSIDFGLKNIKKKKKEFYRDDNKRIFDINDININALMKY